jgi:hypothetical protein
MAQFLDNGAVAPSWMEMVDNLYHEHLMADRTLNQAILREGYIIAKHYPTDPGYANYRTVVYDCLVMVIDGKRTPTWDKIRNCKAQGYLGNAVDYESMSLRAPANWKGKVPDKELVASSTRVLVSFIDGRTSDGVIVGCLTAPDAPVDNKTDGHNFVKVFNGVKTAINKDGEYSVTRTGIIVKDDNTLTKAEDVTETAGAFVKLDKDGNVQINNAHGESIVVNTKTKEITVTARAKTENITEKDWTVNVKGNVNIKASGNASFNASGKTFLGSTKATENVVLGKQLQAALKDIVTTIENFTTTPCIPGQPAMANPIVKIRTQGWKTMYGGPSSPFLSKKKFTE